MEDGRGPDPQALPLHLASDQSRPPGRLTIRCWYPAADSNREPSPSEGDASTMIGPAGQTWCAEPDSNRHCTASRTAPSTELGYPRELVPVYGIEP